MNLKENPSGIYAIDGWGEGVCAAFSSRLYDNSRREDFLRAISLEPQKLVMVKQVHGDAVLWVDEPGEDSLEVPADGLITTTPELVLGIRTADCVPVFFWDPVRKVVGIAHGGWKGVREGIMHRMLKVFSGKMKTRIQDLRVAVGPAIRQCCYEVGKEFLGYFPGFYRQKDGAKGSLDLVAVIKDRLIKRGVLPSHIYDTGLCTVCENKKFFSYRADNKTSERILSVISLKS